MTHEHETPAGPRGPRGRRGGGGPRRGGPFGRPGGWQQGDLPDATDAAGWFTGRIPDDWFTGDLRVTVDRDEITVIGDLAAPDVAAPDVAAPDVAAPDVAAPDSGGVAAAEGRITRWREDTRVQRMKIADEAQARYGRSVAWGARIGETGQLFTHLAVPAMTRLRQSERQVLDTLVDSGVARSRSEALAWCVRLVGQHSDEWLAGLREALSEVERLRDEGPSL
jgi:hypothetical protein